MPLLGMACVGLWVALPAIAQADGSSRADGEAYTQGDDLPIVAQAAKGKAPLAGVTVKLKLVSPSGKEYVQQEQVTDSPGHAQWKSFFTACARTGSWKVVAEVSDGKDKVEVTRTVVLEKIDVTHERVQANITRTSSRSPTESTRFGSRARAMEPSIW